MTTERLTRPSRRTLRVGLPLTIVLLVAAAAVSYFGIASRERERPEGVSKATPPVADASVSPGGPVVSISLPYDEPALPSGPHRQDFQIACSTCHSTRLVMTQPPFAKTKWGEVVHKMVTTYGAPLSPKEEALAVDYLAAVRGK
jgi:hypothetical protein